LLAVTLPLSIAAILAGDGLATPPTGAFEHPLVERGAFAVVTEVVIP
jgi:hypothetical protein